MIAIDNFGGGGQSVDLSPIYRQLYDNSTNISAIQNNTQSLTAIPTIQNDTLVLSNMITNMTTQSGGGGAYWVGDTFGNIAYNMTGSVSDLLFITGKDLTYNSNNLTTYDMSISGIGNCLLQNNALSIPSYYAPYLTFTSGVSNSTSTTFVSIYRNFGVDGFSMISNTISRGNCSFKGLEFMYNSISRCLLNADAYVYSENTVKTCDNVILNNYMHISNYYSYVSAAKIDAIYCQRNTFSEISNFQLNGYVATNNEFTYLKAFKFNVPFISYNSMKYETVGTFNCYYYIKNNHTGCDAVQVNAYSIKTCSFYGDRKLTLNAGYFYNNSAINVDYLSLIVGGAATSNRITNSGIGYRAELYAGQQFNSNTVQYPEGSVNISAHIISANKFSAANKTFAANELRLNCRSCLDNSFSSLTYLYANHAPNNLTNTTLPFDIQSGLYVDHNDDIYDSNLNLNTNITFPESKLFVRGINLMPYVRSCLSLSTLSNITSLTTSVNPEFRFNQDSISEYRFTLLPPSDLDTDMLVRTFKLNPYYHDLASSILPRQMDAGWIIKTSSELPPEPAVLTHTSVSATFYNFIPTVNMPTYNKLKNYFMTSGGPEPLGQTRKCTNMTFYQYDKYSGCTWDWTTRTYNSVSIAYYNFTAPSTITLRCLTCSDITHTSNTLGGIGCFGTTTFLIYQ